MIKKRLGNIGKLTVLIAIRQMFFLVSNWYQLFYQPYLTIKELKEKRDKSQMFLIIFSALTPLFLYVIARIMWDLLKYGELVWLAGRGFLVTVSVETFIFLYLGFWTLKVLNEGER